MTESGDYESLAERSRRGDPAALAQLYRDLAPGLLNYLQRILGQRADAEDVLHDAFLRIFEGRGPYTAEGKFRSWLYTVATRLALDRMARKKRLSGRIGEIREALRSRTAPDPAEEFRFRGFLGDLESALSNLPAEQIMAFHLRVCEGFSYHEIAAISGEPEGTLRSRVHHALKRIRASLEQGRTAAGRRESIKEGTR